MYAPLLIVSISCLSTPSGSSACPPRHFFPSSAPPDFVQKQNAGAGLTFYLGGGVGAPRALEVENEQAAPLRATGEQNLALLKLTMLLPG